LFFSGSVIESTKLPITLILSNANYQMKLVIVVDSIGFSIANYSITHLCSLRHPSEPDTHSLTWQPVTNIPIGGYSVYLDGVRVHQILNPMACAVSLKEKLLFSGARTLTMRALSLDGNSESKDSEPIQLSKSLVNQQQHQQQPEMVSPGLITI
jgi:hypothetical protein